MIPRVCVSIPASNLKDLGYMIRKAERLGADLVEVRLDFMNMEEAFSLKTLEEIVKQANIPLIATNRQHTQGGWKYQDENYRIGTLITAAQIGFQYVDVDLTSENIHDAVQKIKDAGAACIISHHDYERTPEENEMEEILRSQIEAGADVCKLITTANNLSDNIRCLDLTKKFSRKFKIVCFAMGRKGIVSRLLSPIYGALFTYASLQVGLETAPGQIDIVEIRNLYAKLGVLE
ncbi:MAG: type I 3-dehydroquinate dehydratase [Candidatus Bathyarchaeota archaeon]|nr:type I 3-dehydroquinate dehydratase [Candidatus Bathyarchaeota archaeon]